MTYLEIQKYVKALSGRSVKTCWIAHVKEINGIPLRMAPNRQGSNRTNPCPAWARPWIEKALTSGNGKSDA